MASCGSHPGVSGRSEPSRSPSFEAKLLSYNVLFQYRQKPRADGSYPAWVCRGYPFVVDHPELRWRNRFPVLAATLERESPDILGLNEMRGGRPAPGHGAAQGTSQPEVERPDVLGDVTRWLRDQAPHRYGWVSVLDLRRDAIDVDPREQREWADAECRDDMSANGCTSYDPITDHFSAKNYLAYRVDRFALVDSGAFELPLSSTQSRRFAPWARLQERQTGLELLVTVVHLDAFSGAHRVAAARRIASFLERQAPVPVAVLGDFNSDGRETPECSCRCGTRSACSCPRELLEACDGYSVRAVLAGESSSGPRLVDTYSRIHGRSGSSVVRFSVGHRGRGARSRQPCWPRNMDGPERRHLPPLRIERVPRQVDYVLVAPSVEVLDADIPAPVEHTVEIGGERRRVHPSDHLPVTATIRVSDARAH